VVAKVEVLDHDNGATLDAKELHSKALKRLLR
jgi:hypothetical protein